MADEVSRLERELTTRAANMEAMGRYSSPLTGLLREAAEAIGEMRRAIEKAHDILADIQADIQAPGTIQQAVIVLDKALGKLEE